MKKIISVDGGLGRILCSIPAIEKLSKNNKVIVISHNAYDIFGNNPNIERLYKPDYVYMWEDVLKDNELLCPEPYKHHKYYTEQHHLIQSFNYILNEDETFSKPNLYLTESEELWAKEYVGNIKKQSGKPLLIFQPFGRSAEVKQSIKDVYDQSNRSLNLKITLHMINMLSQKYKVIVMSDFATPELASYIPNTQLNIRSWFCIIKHCDYIVGVDSCLQHIGYIFDKPGTVILGSTSAKNISYEDHYQIFVREGYPKHYDIYREVYQKPFWNTNDGAMNWEIEGINKILEFINSDFTVEKEVGDKENGKEICSCNQQCGG